MDPRILRLLFHAVTIAKEGLHSLVLIADSDLAGELWMSLKPEGATCKRQNHHLCWVWKQGGKVTFAKGARDNNITLEQQVKYGLPGVQADNVYVDPALLEVAFADVIERLHRWDAETLEELEPFEEPATTPESETEPEPATGDGAIVQEVNDLVAEQAEDQEQGEGGAPSEPTS